MLWHRRAKGAAPGFAVVLAALLLAPGVSLSSTPDEPKTLSSKSLPWYRGDEHSRLRLRYDFGPAGLILKGPGKRDRLLELRFEIRF